MRQARVEAAERTGVVVDLRDAELARLEILNEALNPVFAEVPDHVDLFDRGIMPGDPPRLWIDMVAHIAMGRDKRIYRFLLDTRYGRRVLVESPQIDEIVPAVTRYIARRLIERERALSGDASEPTSEPSRMFMSGSVDPKWRSFGIFLLGMLAGVAMLLVVAWFLEPLLY